jgi:hypothetical protein
MSGAGDGVGRGGADVGVYGPLACQVESLFLYKDMAARDLLQRRTTNERGEVRARPRILALSRGKRLRAGRCRHVGKTHLLWLR